MWWYNNTSQRKGMKVNVGDYVTPKVERRASE